jgi:hypothetical protein
VLGLLTLQWWTWNLNLEEADTIFDITQRRMDTTAELMHRIQALPEDVQRHILSFVRMPPRKPPLPANTANLLKKLQNSPKRTSMDLKGLEDFVLH